MSFERNVELAFGAVVEVWSVSHGVMVRTGALSAAMSREQALALASALEAAAQVLAADEVAP